MTRIRGSYDPIVFKREKKREKKEKIMANQITKTEFIKLTQKYDDLKKEMEAIKERLSNVNADDPKVKELGTEIVELRKKMDEILIRIEEFKEGQKLPEPKPPEVKEPEPKPSEKKEPEEDESIFM